MNKIFDFKFLNSDDDICSFYVENNEKKSITIGKMSYIGKSTFHLGGGRTSNISIGNYTSIATGCRFLMGMNHNYKYVSNFPFDDFLIDGGSTNHYVDCNHYQIIIGHDVWIGERVTVMGGVTIGHGAVVAACSVVTHDVPPYAVVGGVPAKIIKYRFDKETVKRLMKIKWWYWDKDIIFNSVKLMKKPAVFIEKFLLQEDCVDNNELKILDERKKIFFFVADLEEKYAVYEDVINQYIDFNKDNNYILLIKVDKKYNNNNIDLIKTLYGNCCIYFYFDELENVRIDMLKKCVAIISNGAKYFLKYYDYAMDCGLKLLNGFDSDIFLSYKRE